jgi:hypothetical protein
MTDPQRLSQRSTGLSAELLRAGAEERPNDHGLQQTLLVLGLSGVALSGASAAGAATLGGAKLTSAVSASAGASGIGLTSAATIKAISATLVIKWVGIGVLGGVGLAGVATVATLPSTPPTVSRTPAAPPRISHAPAAPTQREPRSAVVDSPKAPASARSSMTSAPAVGVVATQSSSAALDLSMPLAAEVAYLDRARSLLAAGQSSQGLSLLEQYEQKFPEARLLPEVLFLQLEAYERSARGAEARRAAERLVNGFPKSPHAGRARKLLGR